MVFEGGNGGGIGGAYLRWVTVSTHSNLSPKPIV